MENTCALTILPVIPKWKIYNSVPKKPVKYCAILKEKREFQNLLEHVFSKKVKNSCSIIDKKKIDTSKNKKSLEIIFLNQEEKDLLSLNLSISEKHALRRRNNLLIFLKNNSNNIKYHIEDGSIYVKCDVNIQWHIFYDLFEFLLVKYGICNIGALFYCVLFSGCMLKQEIRFLCCKPIDSSSPSYNFLLDSRESTSIKNSCLTSKKLPKRVWSYQNYLDDNLVPADSQELSCKILSDPIPCRKTMDMNCIMPKQKVPRLDCFCSEIHCKCHETEWKLHRKISKCSVDSYMDILLKKGVTSNDELSIAQGESSFSSTFGNFSNQDFDSLLNNVIENSVPPIDLLPKRNDLPLSQNCDRCSQNPGNQCGISPSDVVLGLINSPAKNKLEPKPESLLKAINLLNEDMAGKETFLIEEFTDKKKSTTLFNMFQTASGKKVNISDTALKKAEEMFTEVMQAEDDSVSDDKSANVLLETKFETERSSSSSDHKSANIPGPVRDKHLNENVDGMLVDGFFEDICFDENDECLTYASQSSSMCNNKLEKLSSVGKVRKSLGGRRSLKPYSKKIETTDVKNL